MNSTSIFHQPVFLFGCPNSGTTILWQSLLKHKQVSGPEIESQDIDDFPDKMKHFLGKSTFRLWAHPKFNLAYYVTENDYIEEEAQKVKSVFQKYLKPGTRLIAKSPADTLRARLIQAYFPDAFFVAIVRNGYAVSEGIVRKREYDPDRPRFKGLFTTIEEAAEQWFRANTIILSHQKYLKKLLVIKYEDLISNTENTLIKVLEFCELDKEQFEMPVFETYRNAMQISSLSGDQIETITRIAGPLLHHYEYPIL